MRRDKAALRIHGRSWLEHQQALLQQCAITRIGISGLQGLPDAVPNLGPLGGLYTGLQQAERPFLLVMAVDMPLLTVAMIKALLEQGPAVAWTEAGGWEPLFGIYPTATHKLLVEQIADSRLAVRNFAQLCFEQGWIGRATFSRPERLRSLNTPDDLTWAAQTFDVEWR